MKTPLNILLVEDSEDDASLLIDELENSAFAVTSTRVETSEQMRAALLDGRWDIVIADSCLPSFDGMRALSLLREIEVDCPFILVSGAIGEEAAVDALRAGASDFVAKGRLARLAPAVRRELQNAESRRRRAALELQFRDHQQRIQSILDHSAALIYVTDREGRFVLTNRAFDEAFGRGSDTLLGSKAELVLSAEAEALRREHSQAATEKDAPVIVEDTFEVAAGRRTFITATFPLHDARGAITDIAAIATDITEQKQLQAKYLHAQKMEAFGQLAGGVAHDFNNILSTMLLGVDMMQAESGVPRTVVNGLTDLRNSILRASALTRQMLLFSRRQIAQPRRLDFNDTVQSCVRMIRRLFPADIELSIIPARAPIWVDADPSMMEQAVMNLALNARDALPKGGRIVVELNEVPADRLRLPVSSKVRCDRFACLKVKDTGIGMDEETLRHSFEPFFTTKPVGKGTGLGLATVYGIATQHSGWVDVDSAPGKGSEFRFCIPAAGSDVPRARREPTTAGARGTETILLAEDEEPLRRVIVQCLTQSGYKVTDATNGVEALAILANAKAPFDVILTDMVMPGGVSGVDLALAARKKWRNANVIIATGYSGGPDVKPVDSVAGAILLPKPFSMPQLLAVLSASIGGKTQQVVG